jgi:5'-nucleotidase
MLNRREFIQKSLAATALLNIPEYLQAEATTKKLVILHTNDTHSRIEPFQEGKYKNMGGAARRVSLIEKIRKENDNVLLLDSGDIWQGTPYFNFFGGELEYKLMSQMRYDLVTLGNHDFDGGMESLIKQMPHATFEFVNANYDFSKTILKGMFQPFKILRKGGLKIGVFGLGIELRGLVAENLYGKTVYEDPIAKAKEMVQELQSKKCDLIICLSHLGYKYEGSKVSDHTLAAQVAGIDLILGGHTHTFLEQPTLINNPEGKPVSIHQVGWAGIMLGKIDVEFSGGKKHIQGTSMLLKSDLING